MTTESTAAEASFTPLDAKTLLARINPRIALLREWLSHDHRDERFWWARRTNARGAQRERDFLRQIANILHVERAMARGRVHGTRFANLDEQKAWLDAQLDRMACPESAAYAGILPHSTLRHLREGALPL